MSLSSFAVKILLQDRWRSLHSGRVLACALSKCCSSLDCYGETFFAQSRKMWAFQHVAKTRMPSLCALSFCGMSMRSHCLWSFNCTPFAWLVSTWPLCCAVLCLWVLAAQSLVSQQTCLLTLVSLRRWATVRSFGEASVAMVTNPGQVEHGSCLPVTYWFVTRGIV